MSVRWLATGSYLPETRLTNEDWAQKVDTNDQWIRKRTGIQERRWAQEETTSDLCIRAAKKALEKADIDPKQIGIILVATMTPNYSSPALATLVQEAIGASGAYGFDISAACSGFVFATNTLYHLLETSALPYGLVIGGETMLSSVDWTDRSTAILFGDGAGALLVEKTQDNVTKLLSYDLHSDGLRALALVSGNRMDSNQKMTMDGRGIFELVVKEVPTSIKAACDSAGLELEDVDLFILHQANSRLIESVAKKLAISLDKFPSNIAQVGNTSAASIPLLLDQLIDQKKIILGSGQTLVLSGFGGGLSWGSIVLTV